MCRSVRSLLLLVAAAGCGRFGYEASASERGRDRVGPDGGDSGSGDGGAAIAGCIAELQTSRSSSCARRTDGELWCWGQNDFGELGDGTDVEPLVPVRAAAMPGSVAFSPGGFHHCVLDAAGAVFC